MKNKKIRTLNRLLEQGKQRHSFRRQMKILLRVMTSSLRLWHRTQLGKNCIHEIYNLFSQ